MGIGKGTQAVERGNPQKVFLAISNNPGKPVPECLHSGFYWRWGWCRWWWQLEL